MKLSVAEWPDPGGTFVSTNGGVQHSCEQDHPCLNTCAAGWQRCLLLTNNPCSVTQLMHRRLHPCRFCLLCCSDVYACLLVLLLAILYLPMQMTQIELEQSEAYIKQIQEQANQDQLRNDNTVAPCYL